MVAGMSKEPMKDRILSLGRRLEKSGPKSLEIRLSGGGLALFRSHGLQVISNEAEEMDTNGTCQVVITPMAGAISGLLISLMKILSAGPDGGPRADFAVQKFKGALSGNSKKPAGAWESDAMKSLVSAALDAAQKSFPPRPEVDEDPMGDFDPFADMEQRASRYWRRAKITIRNAGGELARHHEIRHMEHPHPLSAEPASHTWLRVANIDGVVLAGHWIPLLLSSVTVDDRVVACVLKRLKRLKLKPEIAMVVLADQKSRTKRRAR
jgi:hypothetical protein